MMAGEAARLAAVLGEAPPRVVVVAPYLSELVWSGDLLLVPDGSGSYKPGQLTWLLRNDPEGRARPLLERAALYLLGRAWMHSLFAQPPLPFKPRLSPPGNDQVVSMADTSPERWYQESGTWVQLAEGTDMLSTWEGPRGFVLEPPGEQSALAFWLAMELADPKTRQGDLDLLAYFASVGQQLQGFGERYQMIDDRFWPDALYAAEGRELVWDLHQWAVRAGPEHALRIAVEVVRAAEGWDKSQVLAEMAARSGVPVGEGQP
jgi:hypothetical protein